MNNKEIKIGSNKSFGIVFFVFFLILALYFFYKTNHINYGLLITSLIFLVLGFMNSKILSPLNYIWFKFGLILSLIISPIVMSSNRGPVRSIRCTLSVAVLALVAWSSAETP